MRPARITPHFHVGDCSESSMSVKSQHSHKAHHREIVAHQARQGAKTLSLP